MSFQNPRETGRPITILDEGVPLTRNVGSIDFTGTGIQGSAILDAVTEQSVGLTKEIPTGDIDGVNTVFDFVHEPRFVVLNGAIQEETEDYTIDANYTVTFIIAPQVGSILKSYY